MELSDSEESWRFRSTHNRQTIVRKYNKEVGLPWRIQQRIWLGRPHDRPRWCRSDTESEAERKDTPVRVFLTKAVSASPTPTESGSEGELEPPPPPPEPAKQSRSNKIRLVSVPRAKKQRAESPAEASHQAGSTASEVPEPAPAPVPAASSSSSSSSSATPAAAAPAVVVPEAEPWISKAERKRREFLESRRVVSREVHDHPDTILVIDKHAAGTRTVHEHPKPYFETLLARGNAEVVEINKILERQREGLEPPAQLLTREEVLKKYNK